MDGEEREVIKMDQENPQSGEKYKYSYQVGKDTFPTNIAELNGKIFDCCASYVEFLEGKK